MILEEANLTRSLYILTVAQNIDTGSGKPLFDLLIYGFLFSYAYSWPREYAHYKHEQEAKLKGGAAH